MNTDWNSPQGDFDTAEKQGELLMLLSRQQVTVHTWDDPDFDYMEEQDLALVALIGNELSRACGVGKEVFGVLEPFNIRMICYGASSHNLCFLVPGADAEKVVQKLHHNLFE